MAGRIIVGVTKANPGVKKARAATGRTVRIGASKGARVGAQIMARGRSARGGGPRPSPPPRPSLPSRRPGPSRDAGPSRRSGSSRRSGPPRPSLPKRPSARGRTAPPRPRRPLLRRPSTPPRPPSSKRPSALPRTGPQRSRRPLVRRRTHEGAEAAEGARRRRLPLPFRRRAKGSNQKRSRKHKKSLLYRTLNARKLRRRRRLRRLLVVVAVLVLFLTSMGMFGATSQSSPEGAGGVPLGFVDGIPYADLFNGTVSLGVDPRLVAAIAFVGSGFAPDVVTCARPAPSGRVGIMHLLPDVAAGLGVDPCDPAQAIPAAARYLLAQQTAFGTWELAVAAYHAGPSAVAMFRRIPPYPETVDFVPRVVSQWNAYLAEFPSGSLGTEAPYGPLGSTARYSESRITPTMQHFLDVVVPIFGQGHGIGCYRDQEDGEHPLGRACDFIMQRPLNHMPTQQYLEHGWAFVNYCIAHAAELKLRYIIWQKQIWQVGIGWREYRRYDPNGNLQQNHYDHVHVTVNP